MGCGFYSCESQRGPLAFRRLSLLEPTIEMGRLHMAPLTNNRRSRDVRQIIDKKERETGIEPATSSLGIWDWIVNKEFGVYGLDLKR